MGKAKTELAAQKGGELAGASQYARKWDMEGADSSDYLMPRVVLHQGDISEKAWGQHPKGTLLDSATQEVITARKFVAVGVAWKQWARFDDGRPVYITRNKAEVPPEDLVWGDDHPPAAEVTRNFVVLFEGSDSPICLALKESSKLQRNAGKRLNQLERMRANSKKAPGFYEITIVDAQNDRGKWKEMDVKPCGNAPEDMLAQAAALYEALSGVTIKTSDDHAENDMPTDSDFDPNAAD